LAARERLGVRVTGFDPTDGVLGAARDRGAVDVACASVREAVAAADTAVVAAPVGALPAAVAEVLAAAPPDCVVTDVGSTKRAVVASTQDERFVGGHPLAGAETKGVEHARADLFDGATWYLTPTEATSGLLYHRLHSTIVGLGAQPAAIDASDHDRVLAAVSHLPHVLANVLVAQAGEALPTGAERLTATGPSFRPRGPTPEITAVLPSTASRNGSAASSPGTLTTSSDGCSSSNADAVRTTALTL